MTGIIQSKQTTTFEVPSFDIITHCRDNFRKRNRTHLIGEDVCRICSDVRKNKETLPISDLVFSNSMFPFTSTEPSFTEANGSAISAKKEVKKCLRALIPAMAFASVFNFKEHHLHLFRFRLDILVEKAIEEQAWAYILQRIGKHNVEPDVVHEVIIPKSLQDKVSLMDAEAAVCEAWLTFINTAAAAHSLFHDAVAAYENHPKVLAKAEKEAAKYFAKHKKSKMLEMIPGEQQKDHKQVEQVLVKPEVNTQVEQAPIAQAKDSIQVEMIAMQRPIDEVEAKVPDWFGRPNPRRGNQMIWHEKVYELIHRDALRLAESNRDVLKAREKARAAEIEAKRIVTDVMAKCDNYLYAALVAKEKSLA